eukprot:scaffold231074_cov49-Attheya_sp.AAC.2
MASMRHLAGCRPDFVTLGSANFCPSDSPLISSGTSRDSFLLLVSGGCTVAAAFPSSSGSTL